MKGSNSRRCLLKAALLASALLVPAGLAGCQSDPGGQTLPSPYYMTDDVQYFPHGAQFKLSKEAAAMKAAAEEQAATKR
jgi:hypothetical protein